MSEEKYSIRPFDRNKVRRVRKVTPPPPIPKTAEEWKQLEYLRNEVDIMRRSVRDMALSARRINDPVVSRAVLAIHYALKRIETRAFTPYLMNSLENKGDGS